MKTLGLIILAGSVIFFGVFSSYKTKRILFLIKNILNFMYYTKTQIECFNTPLDAIYKKYAEKNECEIRELIENISKNGWASSLETNCNHLPDSIQDLLLEYGENLGKTNKQEQLKHSIHYTQMLEEKYKEMVLTTPDKIKLSMALSIYSGLMLIILFI